MTDKTQESTHDIEVGDSWILNTGWTIKVSNIFQDNTGQVSVGYNKFHESGSSYAYQIKDVAVFNAIIKKFGGVKCQ